MKVTFRTVSGESFQHDIEESTTVGALKALLEETRSIARDTLKLVYKGKVLEKEEATVAECSIEEKGFIVVFVTKPAKAAVEPSTVPAVTPAAPAASTPVPAPAAAAAAIPATTVAATAEPAGAAFGSLLTGSALETAISNICEMGFAREEVMRAMRAAFNNPERAVEYLMTGIPESAAPPPPAAVPAANAGGGAAVAAAAPAAAVAATAPPQGPGGALPFNMFGPPVPAAAAGGGTAAAGGGAGGALDFLRNSQQFQLLRNAVRGNPGILTPMLQELGRQNPQLIQMIQGNQEDFLRILQEEPQEGEMDLGGMGFAGEGDEEGGGGMVVELNEEDVAKVERLEALGFQRDACIEALLACDRNEEMAANFLAEQMFD